MHFPSVKTTLFAAGLSISAVSAQSLFDCDADQHAFPPRKDYFVVHYTSIRDTNFEHAPWIRICRTASGGGWNNVAPLTVPCSGGGKKSFSTGDTGLDHTFTVKNGNGCDDSASNLDGAYMEYDGQSVNLQDGGAACGPRDHGISCQFFLS